MRADSRVQKLRALITTVDPSQRLIHGQTVDNSPISISLFEIPGAFTWPQEGEVWSVYKENNSWRLGGRIQNSEDARRVEDLRPGQSLQPVYHEVRIPTGTTAKVVSHNLGSKALSSRIRPAFVGYRARLAKDITGILTSSMTIIESESFGGGLRPSSMTAWALIDDEIIKFASQSSSGPEGVLGTLTRGQFGTTPAPHSAGSEVTLFTTSTGTSPPGSELIPIDNERALIQFGSATTFPIDLALVG